MTTLAKWTVDIALICMAKESRVGIVAQRIAADTIAQPIKLGQNVAKRFIIAEGNVKSTKPLPIRAYVLWACAGLLGIAVGIKFIGYHTATPGELKDMKAEGFTGPSDADPIYKLLGAGLIKHLSDSDLDLMQKYASGKPGAQSMVCGVMVDVVDPSTAMKCLPIAKAILKTGRMGQFLTSMQGKWKESGCTEAAAKLKVMLDAAGVKDTNP